MNKNFKYYLGVWAVLLAIFNVVSFVSPSEIAGVSKYTGSFWVGYIFITIAFIGQLASSYFALKEETAQKLFYKIPLINISWVGLILTLIVGAVFMIVPIFPIWIGIVVCFIILGFNVISLTTANATADIVAELDAKVKTKTEFIKMLSADAEHLMNVTKEVELKNQAKKVFEAIRYSDPMSNVALAETEMKIEKVFSDFSDAINVGNTEKAIALGAEIISLIDLRNKKCKLLK